ncbi:polyribonucleotide nucleotidyltransferase [Helicobacter ailurogastricus]|uniref:Polyribonucleotide nucleotidyltransferase n=1 Tax=Helicobacter ailurogastricus TaxID=1578720 RepID=A0A0K2Y750_9HELI|nr:polyribonucleotide nucleotidyltransferase [Helicobacter ailurogastricus]BDQ28434.1 polyribonucleotide nucleotidyltransferase [Helicobacter ailurogastricus]CRF52970.1 Polyribonucleotide nucleotidyltransferase [Helicobacter ailurogastricus]
MQKINIDTQEFILDYMARQATSALLYSHKATRILASVVVGQQATEEDFLPLSVQYNQRAYAVGRLPGNFTRREGKMEDFETLTSRLIDRSLRPLFPKGYAYPTQITLLLLSHAYESDLQVCALNAAASALYLANVGVEQTIHAMRLKDNFDLFVAGTKEAILMIEMQANEAKNPLSEPALLKLLESAHSHIKEQCALYTKHFDPHRKPKLETPQEKPINPHLMQILSTRFKPQILETMSLMAKSERGAQLEHLLDHIAHELNEHCPIELSHALHACFKEQLHKSILDRQERADGRGLKQIRPIHITTNLLPACHSSVFFERGHTQALVTCTLGAESDAKQNFGLQEANPSKERFMLHYNFLPFSVGEAAPLSAPSRRELGHGYLAQKALSCSLPENAPVIRLVSEILESNGSSSMASVCAGSLALRASGVEPTALIAGVAMGLVFDGTKHAILSDISALEDMQGDMDFKIAGTDRGIVAMQMDTKLAGLPLEWLPEILEQAKEARLVVLDRMQEAAKNIQINTNLPTTESFYIPTQKMSVLIGPGGKHIKDILQRFSVQIDLDKSSGLVSVRGMQEAVGQAKDYISKALQLQEPCVGQKMQVFVKRVVDFGVFVRLETGGDALLHKSNAGDLDLARLENGAPLWCEISKIEQGKVHVILA